MHPAARTGGSGPTPTNKHAVHAVLWGLPCRWLRGSAPLLKQRKPPPFLFLQPTAKLGSRLTMQSDLCAAICKLSPGAGGNKVCPSPTPWPPRHVFSAQASVLWPVPAHAMGLVLLVRGSKVAQGDKSELLSRPGFQWQPEVFGTVPSWIGQGHSLSVPARSTCRPQRCGAAPCTEWGRFPSLCRKPRAKVGTGPALPSPPRPKVPLPSGKASGHRQGRRECPISGTSKAEAAAAVI